MREELIDQVMRLPPRERREFLRRVSGGPAPAPADRTRTGEFPASAGQRSQWFLWRLDPGNAVYHVSTRYEVRGRLRTDTLAEALGDLRTRHEALRTTFRETGDGLVQVVGEPGSQAAGEPPGDEPAA